MARTIARRHGGAMRAAHNAATCVRLDRVRARVGQGLVVRARVRAARVRVLSF